MNFPKVSPIGKLQSHDPVNCREIGSVNWLVLFPFLYSLLAVYWLSKPTLAPSDDRRLGKLWEAEGNDHKDFRNDRTTKGND